MLNKCAKKKLMEKNKNVEYMHKVFFYALHYRCCNCVGKANKIITTTMMMTGNDNSNNSNNTLANWLVYHGPQNFE